jgi:general secretion pathway protein D
MEDRVLKTTTKFIAGVAMVVGLSPQCGTAGVQTALPFLLSAASLGDDGRSAIAQADALLREARAAMAEGKYEIADSKIAQAESLQPKYPFLHIGDTPKKARGDFDRLLAEKSGGVNHKSQRSLGKTQNTAPTDPFLAGQPAANPDNGSAKPAGTTAAAKSENTNSTGNEPGASAGGSTGSTPIAKLRMPGVSGAAAPSDNSAGLTASNPAINAKSNSRDANPWEIEGAARSSTPAKSDQQVARTAPRPEDQNVKNQNAARAQSDALLLESRRLLAHGDVRNAQIKAQQVRGLALSYGALDDSPAKIEALIQKTSQLPANVVANDSEAVRRLRAEVLTEQAEGLLRWREYDEAARLAGEVQQLDLHYGPLDPKPQQILDRIAAAKRATGAPDAAAQLAGAAPAALPLNSAVKPIESAVVSNKQRASEMAQQARAAMAQGDWVTAEQIARQAESLAPDTAFSPTEDRPTLVLLDIERVKRGKGPLAAGTVRPAPSGIVQASAVSPIQPETSPSRSDNRYPDVQALYDPATDSTRNVPANNPSSLPDRSQLGKAVPQVPALGASNFAPPMGNMEPTPENGTGEGLRWYRAGVEAVAKLRMDEALQAFRRSYAFQTELDPATRQQLYEHLKILGEAVEPLPNAEGNPIDAVPTDPKSSGPAPASAAPSGSGAKSNVPMLPVVTTAVPTPESASSFPSLAATAPASIGSATPASATSPIIGTPPAPLETPSVSSATLSRQVAAEVTRQQNLARDMREKQPKQALELLKRTRQMVASVAGIDPPAREQLLRRLDMTIADLQQYVAANAPEIEQEEKNRQVQQDVDRTRKEKVETDEKISALVKDFNRMLDEQRYAEAQVLAKRATELDPNNPVVVQLNVMAKTVSRVAQNQHVQDQQEKGFWDTMEKVDEAAVPFAGEYQMPEAKKWADISKSKFRQQREGQLHRSAKEQEIEQRLSTPVALKFEKRPLAEVIEYLGKIAQVPTYLDPQGLQAEGVGSDTPISIDLSQDISLKSALKLILEPLRLTFVIKDEVLKVTSEDVKRGQLYTVMYPVGDLVIRIPNFAPTGQEGINGAFREAMARMGWGGAAGGSFGASAPMLAVNEPAGNSNINPAVLAQMRNSGVPIPVSGSGATQSGSPQSIPFGPGGMKGGSQADFDTLIDLITSTISPQTWSEMGGPGTIQGFDTNLSLVVSQTQEVHEQIADLLQQLRKLQDLQVTIEVRFITLVDDFFERIGVDFQFNLPVNAPGVPSPPPIVGPPPSYGPLNPSAVIGIDSTGLQTPLKDLQYRYSSSFTGAIPQFGAPGGVFSPTDAATFGFAILSDIQAFFLVQAAQGDSRSNVLQAPKVTLYNGQQATVSDTTQEPFVVSVIPVVGDFAAAQQPVIVVLSEGTSLTVQAVVSNDRRFVRLTVVPFFSNIGQVNTFTFTGSSSSTSKSSESSNQTDQSKSNSNESDSANTSTTVQLPQFSFVTVTTTVNVPDGGTVLLGGIKRLSEGRAEQGVPVLSKLPYVNRLFRNTGIGRSTVSLMMMVTPRIIIQEEEEDNLLGNTAP